MSLRASTCSPDGLLGRHVHARAHHGARPLKSATEVRDRSARPGSNRLRRSLASPKSSTFTHAVVATITLAGFRSRWTMPLLVRGFERVGDCEAIAALVERHRALREQLLELLPSTHSITRNQWPSVSSTS